MTAAATSVLTEFPVLALEPERFEEFVAEAGEWKALVEASGRIRRMLEAQAVWMISSPSRSGGLADLVQSQAAYARGAGVDARWAVISASDDFFRLGTRLDDDLYGGDDDGGDYGDADRRLYEETLGDAAGELTERLGRDDIVMLHDAVTAGMIPAVKAAGAVAIWRCRVGTDAPNGRAERGWRFLAPFLQAADACVFTRRQFVWDGLDEERAHVIPPSLNPLSPKNQALSESAVSAILAVTGIQPGSPRDEAVFTRVDGSPGRVDRQAEVVQSEPLEPGTDVILQVSQWNRLKDPPGVVDWFGQRVAPHSGAHLVLAGPEPSALPDEPEAPAVLEESLARIRGLPTEIRARVHLATIPADDPEEGAAVINALQRRSAIAVQKSRSEGFGMTVLESMWKNRPVVGSRVGALQDHIVDGATGFVRDPDDLDGFADATLRLLEDPPLREKLGAAGRERVRRRSLLPRELADWAALVERLVARSGRWR
jgi:trehalose synthase